VAAAAAVKNLGGVTYLTMKLLSMLTWTLFFYGGAVAFGAYYMATDDLSTEFDRWVLIVISSRGAVVEIHVCVHAIVGAAYHDIHLPARGVVYIILLWGSRGV
jgi:hypothetical protein